MVFDWTLGPLMRAASLAGEEARRMDAFGWGVFAMVAFVAWQTVAYAYRAVIGIARRLRS